MATLRNPRFLIFLGVWIGLNALFGFGSMPIGEGAGQEVAWQAHIGGFIAGTAAVQCVRSGDAAAAI